MPVRIQESPKPNPGRLPEKPKPAEKPEQFAREAVRDAFVHVGKEASREAIVGATLAGVVLVGDSCGHPLLGRAAALGLGALRGVAFYGDNAKAALGSSWAGNVVAGTLGAGTAMLCAGTGNILQGIAVGGLIGVIQSPKTYPGT